jgi:mono/diheme cytochrome c family protein
MKRSLLIGAAALVVLAALGALFVGAGMYNVAADEVHTPLVYRLLETVRERSIAARAKDIAVPDLTDPAMARRGAGNYDAMCVGCHLAPGVKDSELSVGLNPTPPNLSEHAHSDAAEAFWVIKHGIKATGMPAWGKHMEDFHIWDLVAFLRKLPSLSAEQYAAEVAASGGHSHDEKPHSHSHDDAAGGHDRTDSAAPRR